MDPITTIVAVAASKFFEAWITVIGEAAAKKLGLFLAGEQAAYKLALHRTINWYRQDESSPKAYADALVLNDGPLGDQGVTSELLEMVRMHRDPDPMIIGERWQLNIKNPPAADCAAEARRFVAYLKHELWATPEFVDLLDSKAFRDILDVLKKGTPASPILPMDANLQKDTQQVPRENVGILLHNVPPLPPHFLPRKQDIETIKDALFANASNPVGITGSPRRIGIQGMGGIGKSVVAAAVAHDPDVQHAFPDGVYWMTLGETSNLTLRQANLAASLGGGQRIFDDIEQGGTYLSELLAEKTCLLILDDAWQIDAIRSFDRLGPNVRMMFTTRDKRIITGIGATEHQIKVLDVEQSLDLLAEWAELDVSSLPIEAKKVANECGGLPLAIALCGAQVRDGVSWIDLFDALRSADLEFLDHPHGSVLKSIKISIDALAKENSQWAECYQSLAVFPHDIAIPQATVVRLWQTMQSLNERQARQLTQILARKSMLWLVDESSQCRIELHDLQHDYLRQTINSQHVHSHKALIDAYRKDCSNGWSSGPNDGYFFQHLVYHLIKADNHGEVYELLIRSSHWKQSRFAVSQNYAGYLGDLETALNLYKNSPPSSDVSILIQLLAARQVLQQWANRYDNNALRALVWLGRDLEALSYAKLRSEPEARFLGLLGISQSLVEKGTPDKASPLFSEVELVADSIEDIGRRIILLVKLAACLSDSRCQTEESRIYAKAESVATSIKDKTDRDKTMLRLAQEVLKYNNLTIAERVVSSIEDISIKEEAFNELDKFLQAEITTLLNNNELEKADLLADKIKNSDIKEHAKKSINKINKHPNTMRRPAKNRVDNGIKEEKTSPDDKRVVSRLMELGRSGQIAEAEKLANRNVLSWEKVELIGVVALIKKQVGLLEESERLLADAEQVFSQVDRAASDQILGLNHIKALFTVADALMEPESLTTPLADTRIVKDGLGEAYRAMAKAMARIGQFEIAEKFSEGIESAEFQLRDEAFVALGDALISAGLITDANRVAGKIVGISCGIKLVGLIMRAEKSCSNHLLDMLLYKINHLQDRRSRTEMLGQLALTMTDAEQPALGQNLFAEAGRVVASILDPQAQSNAKVILVQFLSQARYYMEAEQVAKSIDYGCQQGEALSLLARILAQERHFDEAERIAVITTPVAWKNNALVALVKVLAQAGQTAKVLRVLSDIGEDKSRIEALNACGEILIQNDSQILPDIVPQRPSLQLRTTRFKQVCSSLGIEDIDCFVSDALATTEGDFSNYLRYIFTEISRIYGWNSEEWRKIYEKLA